MRLSVVLPVFGNHSDLPTLYARLTTTLEQSGDAYELVFVDDAGDDGSLEWLQGCRARDDRVQVVDLRLNQGQHRAVIAGLAVARGDVVVVMDADLQDAPEDIPGLLCTLEGGAGAVFAIRASRYESRARHATGFLFKRLLRVISGSRLPNGYGMFLAVSRDVASAVTRASGPSPYVPLLIDQTGCPIRSIPIEKARADGKSAYTGCVD